MTVINYESGSAPWLALLRNNRLLVLQGPISDMQLAALWEALSEATGLQSILDELVRPGISAVPPFAMIDWANEGENGTADMHSIVRGAVSLIVLGDGDPVSLDGRSVSTWVEKHVSSVRGFELILVEPSVKGGKSNTRVPVLPLESGVVWASHIWSGTILSLPGDPHVKITRAGAVPDSETARELPSRSDTVDDATIADLTTTVIDGPPTDAAAARSEYDHLFGETVVRTVEDAAVRATDEETGIDGPEPLGGLSEDGFHDGQTVMHSDLAAVRAGRKSRRAAKTVSTPAPRLTLELSGGGSESLSTPLIVGRAPSVSKVSGEDIPRLLTVTGLDQDISRNHVRFAVEGETVVVTDLHSRNGTQVILPGRPPQQLRPGEPTPVIVGTVVDLGGGVAFTVREQ